MVMFVLDASALLRLLFREPGFERVQKIFDQHESVRIVMSAVNWGEVIGKTARIQGRVLATQAQAAFEKLGLEIISASADRAGRAALLKRDWKLGYADAFCVELAASYPGSILVTADFEFRAVASLVQIEFLPDHLGRTTLQ